MNIKVTMDLDLLFNNSSPLTTGQFYIYNKEILSFFLHLAMRIHPVILIYYCE